MTDERFEFDLVLRSEVEVDAPRMRVWEQLERVQEWKASVVSVERIGGAPGEIGEALRIGQSRAGQVVYVHMKTLEQQPGAWKVQTLETEDGRTTRGYVAYTLHESQGRTQVIGQLIARASLPLEAVPSGQSADQASRMICEATRAKMDADHRVLKQRIEGRP